MKGVSYWLVIAVLLAAVPIGRGAELPYAFDFESAPGSEWSDARRDTNVPSIFTIFSGRFGNEPQTLTLSNLTPGVSCSVFFDLCIVDSWDTEWFRVAVQGSNVFAHTFRFDLSGQSYPVPPDVGPANYGWAGWNDSIYRNVEAVFVPTASVVQITFRGYTDEAIDNESWGIDNVRVDWTTNLPTVIISTTLPAEGSTNSIALDSFNIMALRNLQGASATNTSNYELRGAGSDLTFGTGDDTLYTLVVSTTGPRRVNFAINYPVLQPGLYRFSATNLLDLNAQPMSNFVRTFTIAHPLYGKIESLSNETRAEAVELPVTETPGASGFLTALGVGVYSNKSDVDYYSFNAEAGDRVTIRLETESSINQRLRLEDASGNSLNEQAVWPDTAIQIQNYAIANPGTYYIRCWPDPSSGAYSKYRVRLDIGRGTRQLEQEGNDSQGAATPMTLTFSTNGFQGRVAGSLPSADSAGDYWCVTYLNAGNSLIVSPQYPACSTLLTNNALRISIEVAGVGEVLVTNGTPFTYVATASGLYYIRLYATNRDLRAQYVLDVLGADAVAPSITGCTLPSEGSTNSSIIDRFDLTFSEYMSGQTVSNTANYEMRSAGPNGTLGDADDIVYGLSVSYAGGLTASYVVSGNGPLQLGLCRFTARTGLTDRVGLPIAAAYERTFTVAGVANFVNEARNNDTIAGASSLSVLRTNAPDGSFIAGTAISTPRQPRDVVAAHFNTDSNLDLAVACAGADLVAVFEGRGDGTFWSPLGADYVESLSNNSFAAVGTAQGWRADDTYWTSSIPFAFPFYGNSYTQCFINSNGQIVFGAGSAWASPLNSIVICGLYEDLRTDGTGEDIFIESLPDRFTVRWAGRYYGTTLPVNFSVTLFSNGTVRCSYGSGNANGGTIGVSAGDSFRSTYSTLSGAGSKDTAPDIYFVWQESGRSSRMFAVGPAPFALAAGHFNAGTNLDLAVANSGTNWISVLLSVGDGTFSAAVHYVVGASPRGIVAGDFNNDGRSDLAAACYGADAVYVLLGNGDGTFGGAASYPVGAGPYGLACGYFNADANLDLAVANYNGTNVSILLGNGAGGFAEAAHYGAGRGSIAVATNDFNGDGITDLIVANVLSNSVSVLLGVGDGTFGAAAHYASSNSPYDVLARDLDLDGFMDAAVARFDSDAVGIHAGLGGGMLSINSLGIAAGDGPCALAWGDFDSDGPGDIAVADYEQHRITILRGNWKESLAEDPAGSTLKVGAGRGNLTSSSDQDYWSFYGRAGDWAMVAVEVPGNPADSGLSYALFRPDGVQLTSFNAAGQGYGQSAPVVLPVSGRYTVRVTYNYSYWGEYRLRVIMVTPPVRMETEGNDTIGTANVPSFVQTNTYLEARIAGYIATYDTNGDYFAFGTLTSGTVVQIRYGKSSVSPLVGMLDLIDSTGTEVARTTNRALRLDGSGDYMRHSTTGFSSRNGTVEGWVRPFVTASWGFWQTHDSNGENWNDWLAMFSWTDGTFYFRVGNGSQCCNNDVTFPTASYIPPGYWSHLAFTWETTNLRVYVNGALVASRSNAVLQDVMDPWARLGQGHGRIMNGLIDEVRIWNVARSQAEISNSMYSGLSGAEAGLQAYFTFDDGTPTDFSTNANDGLLAGDAVIVNADGQGDPANPNTYPTNVVFTIRSNGVYYARIRGTLSTRGLLSDYLLTLMLSDPVPPAITACTLPAEGSTVTSLVDSFTLSFSKDMMPSSVSNAANYELRSAGADQVFSNADDEVYALGISYSSGTNASYTLPDGPLQPGNYRFTARATLADRYGNTMTGAYVRLFTIAGVAGYVTEGRTNGTIATATSLRSGVSADPDGSFTLSRLFGTATNPATLLLRRFDGDTNLDIAVASHGEDCVTILRGNGDGTFTTSRVIAVGNAPLGLAAGYFNADTNLDLAVAHYADNNVRILLGTGAGNFTKGALLAVGTSPRDIKAADLDNDGDVDLAVVNWVSGSVSVLLGNGDGTFAAAVAYPTGTGPYALDTADFNGDGRLDIITADNDAGTISILYGNGDGTFTSPTSYGGLSSPRGVAVGFFNADAYPDVAVSSYGNNRVAIFTGSGAGGLTLQGTYTVGTGPWGLALDDLDGDGALDVAVATYSAGVSVLLGQGDGSLESRTSYAISGGGYSVAAGDVNSDGRLDLVVAGYSGSQIAVLLGNAKEPMAENPAGSGLCSGYGRGNLSNSADDDYWSFFAEAGDTVMVAIEIPGNPDSSGLRCEVYTAGGDYITGFNAARAGYGQTVFTATRSGRHAVRVSYNYSYWGEYRLRVTVAKAPTCMEVEDNGSLAAANPLVFRAAGGTQTCSVAGYIATVDSNGDIFRLGNLLSGTQIRVTLARPTDSPLTPLLLVKDGAGLLVNLNAASTNYALYLDGSGDYVNLGTWAPTGQWAVAAWMQPWTWSGLRVIAGNKHDGRDWGVVMSDARPSAVWRGGELMVTAPQITVPAWTHVAGMCDGTSVLLYVNGELVATRVTTSYVPTTAGTRIGSSTCCGEYFYGLVDEVGMWGRVLSQDEVRSAMTNGLSGGEPGLLGAWNFDGGNASDISTNGRNGTLVGDARIMRVARENFTTSIVCTVPSNGTYYVHVSGGNGGLAAQYLANITLVDVQPPTITSCTLPANGSITTSVVDRFTLTFSEDMAATAVSNPATYSLTCGLDVYRFAITYTGGLSATYVITNGPLQPGVYNFLVRTNLTDAAGVPLAAAYTSSFTVAGLAGYQLESRNNDTMGTATALSLADDPAGSGVRSGFGRGNIMSSSDYDWWSFTAQAGDLMVLAAEVPGNPVGSSLRYRVYKPDGAQVTSLTTVSSDGSMGGYGQTAPVLLTNSGTHYVRVESYDAYRGEYRFRVTVASPPWKIETEVNDSPAAANAFTLVRTNGQQQAWMIGYIGVKDPSGDYFALGNLSSGALVTVNLGRPASSTNLLDVAMLHTSGWYVASTSNRVLQLDGSSGYVDLGNWFEYQDFTILLWVRPATTQVQYADLIDNNHEVSRNWVIQQDSWTTNRMAFGVNAGGGGSDWFWLLPDVWQQMAFVRDSATRDARVYRNGQLFATGQTVSNLINYNSVYLRIGRWGGGGRFWNGRVDDVRMWNRVLSEAEIAAAVSNRTPANDPGLVGYWDFEGSAADISTNGHNGTLQGGSAIVTWDIPGYPAVTTRTYTVPSNGRYCIRVTGEGGLAAQYLLTVAVTDAAPPTIASCTLPEEGSTNTAFFTSFGLTFSEDMDPATVSNAANYELRGAGADGLLDTADDALYALQLGNYGGGLSFTLTVTNGPVQAGAGRFTAFTGLTDLIGNPMASNWTRRFVVADVPHYAAESRTNNTRATATPLTLTEDPAGLWSAGGRGHLFNAADTDCWSFVAQAGDLVSLGTESFTNQASSVRLRYTVEDAAGTQLASLVPPDGNYGRGTTNLAAIASNGTYYVRVTYYDGYYGEYRFRIMLARPPLQSEREGNDSIAAATALTLTPQGDTNLASAAGYIATSADLDYFRIGVVTQGMTILVSTRQPTNSPLLPVVSVYNAAGQYQSEYRGANDDGVAEVRITQSNTYYVVIRQTESSHGLLSSYVLDIQVLPTGILAVPNLRVVQINPPASGVSGQNIFYSYVVQNVGSEVTDASSWLDRVLLSTNGVVGDADDIAVNIFVRTGVLNPEESYTNSQTFRLPDGISGSYRIIVQTDVGNAVYESIFEGDNTTVSSAFPVTLDNYPDLRVESISWSGSNEIAYLQTVQWNLANRGTKAVSSNFYERVTVSNQSAGTLLLNEERVVTNAIPVNGTVARQVTFTPPTPGVYRVEITADSRNNYFEIDTNTQSHAVGEQNTVGTNRPITRYWIISASTNPAGSGFTTGGGRYADGAMVTVTAQANTNALPYYFVNWTEYGNPVSVSTSLTFVAQRDRYLSANFTLPAYTIAATASPPAGGTISGTGTYFYASTNVLLASPNTGYRFVEWREGAVVVGTAPAFTNVVYSNRAFTAVFDELNKTHTVTTATSPTGLAVVTGAGIYTNGQQGTFTAPVVVTNGPLRYTFVRFTKNAVLFSLSNSVSYTFTTADPTNVAIVAEYSGMSIKPVIVQAFGSHSNPVPNTTNFVLTFRFDRTMAVTNEPAVAITNNASGRALAPPTGGVWQTSAASNDTYVARAVSFTNGMDGNYDVWVQGARALDGETLDATNALQLQVNSTMPSNPVVSVLASNRGSITIGWLTYTPPADLAGFRIYLQTNDFTSARGLTPVASLNASALYHILTNLVIDRPYYAAVAAVDTAGNTNADVATVFVFLPNAAFQPNPPTVVCVSPTTIRTQTVYGTKEAWTDVRINGTQVVAVTSSTNWSCRVTLTPGTNVLSFTSVDTFGYISLPVLTNIVFNDTAPSQVVAQADGNRNGLSIALTWTNYDEYTAGADIWRYLVYYSQTNFANVSNALLAETVPGGIKQVVVTNLLRNTLYYLAVVAQDLASNMLTAVSPTNALTRDITPPPNPTGVWYTCSATSLVVRWGIPVDVDGDLAGFRLYITNNPVPVNLPASTNAYLVTGLSPATSYVFQVRSVDNDTNVSSGVTSTGVTWLANPTGLWADPYSSVVDLYWDAVQPSNLVKHFAVYRDVNPFTSVTGLTPVLNVTGTSASVAGLVNNQTYYFAVVTVNLSDGFDPSVTIVAATPRPDTQGPLVSNLQFRGAALTNGLVVREPGALSLNASDRAGMSRVEFWINGEASASVISASGLYSTFWNVGAYPDGTNWVEWRAYDSLNNVSWYSNWVVVALEPPTNLPVITSPADGTAFNVSNITVSGTVAAHLTNVVLYVNGVSNSVASAWNGSFAGTVRVPEGTNDVSAAAMNRAGAGPMGSPVSVIVDSSRPNPPTKFQAAARANGVISLSWLPPINTRIKGYHLYCSTSPFSSMAEAVRVNSALLTTASYDDLPAADGTYYYRISTVNYLGTEGDLSTEASATSDRVAPRLTSITYESTGPSLANRYGIGQVTVVLTFSEKPSGVIFFSLARTNATPISPPLYRVSDTVYQGTFEITSNTPAGFAYASFSARDAAGNRGTEIDAGMVIQIDTEGPVADVAVQPAAPIRNDPLNPVTVTATLSFAAADVPAITPTLRYALSVSQPAETALSLARISDTQWRATFLLPATAGQTAEWLRFSYVGVDAVDNVGTSFAGAASFLVYQGDLPPLSPPSGLQARAGKGGSVTLTWLEVSNAHSYAIYRRAPGEGSLTWRTAVTGVVTYSEIAPDGTNWYALASVRWANGQYSTSALGSAVSVVADSIAPLPPSNLTAALYGNGLCLTWAPSPSAGTIRYSVYRDASPITNVAGRTAIVTRISTTNALDSAPAAGGLYYAVTAYDAVTNESGPSANVYTNISLLPVRSVRAVKPPSALPVLSWTHGNAGAVDGFNVYVGSNRVNAALLPNTTFTNVDTGYNGTNRLYAVTAVDVVGAVTNESLPHSLLLPAVVLTRGTNFVLNRGVMNRLTYTLENSSGTNLAHLRIGVAVQGYVHWSDEFSLAAGCSTNVGVAVGGYSNLADFVTLTNAVESRPNETDQAVILGLDYLAVGDDKLTPLVESKDLVRGASGSARFQLVNTCPEEIEIITALRNGASPSSEVRFKLTDADGMVYAVVPLQQAVGAMVFTLPDGTSVARVGPGETFTCNWVDLPVPLSVPSEALVELEVDRLHHRYGYTNHVVMQGFRSSVPVRTEETEYYGTLTNVTPVVSYGETNVLLQGRAISRATGAPAPLAALRLVISVCGFERSWDLTTDANGNWSYDFVPQETDAGTFTVRIVHPNVTDKPEMGTFQILRASVSPTYGRLTCPRNYNGAISVRVTANEGLALTNLNFAYVAEDQPGGVFSNGVSVITNAPVAVVPEKQTATLSCAIRADTNAPESARVVLRVISANDGGRVWGAVIVDCNFLPESVPQPILTWSPSFIETGVAISNVVTESVKLKNTGFATLQNVRLSLVDTNGAPAPAWVILNAASNQGNLAVGAEKTISVTFAPGTNVAPTPLTPYRYLLRVAADNYPTRDVSLFVWVDQAGVGSVFFKVTDIYTGTIDTNTQEVIQGVAGARIKLIKQEGTYWETNLVTDAMGEALGEGIPAGRYSVRVQAADHNAVADVITVRPGATATKEIFLQNALVTIEWTVVPTTIEDKYEIVLTALYKTEVPAPVVVAEPPSVKLPPMQPGDVYNAEVTLKNYGLIQAENLRTEISATNDAYFRVELLAQPPSVLAAHEVVRVPYRITYRASLTGSGQSGGGQPCKRWVCTQRTWYRYKCADGTYRTNYIDHYVFYEEGDCGGNPAVGPAPGLPWWISYGFPTDYSGGPGGIPMAPYRDPRPVQGAPCWLLGEVSNKCIKTQTPLQFALDVVKCGVDLINRDYIDWTVDLVVPAEGGASLTIGRSFYMEQWNWYPSMSWLTFETNITYQKVLGRYYPIPWRICIRDGVPYTNRTPEYLIRGTSYLPNEEPGVFVNHEYRIVETGTGAQRQYWWSDPRGNWMRYDYRGRLQAEGTIYREFFRYITDASGRLTAVQDGDGAYLCWFQYDGEGRVTSVMDRLGRQVSYTYESGRLKSVRDALGYTTVYYYDARGRMIRTDDEDGHPCFVTYDTAGGAYSLTDEKGEGRYYTYQYNDYTKEKYAQVVNSDGVVREYYFGADNELRRQDVNGRTEYRLSKSGRTRTEYDAYGNAWSVEYDEYACPVRIIYPDGEQVLFSYQLLALPGNVVVARVPKSIRQPGGLTTLYEYSADAMTVTKTEAPSTSVERVTTYELNAFGLPWRVTRHGDSNTETAVTVFTFDADGNLASVTSPEGETTLYRSGPGYVEVQYPGGAVWTNLFDAEQRWIAAKDPAGYVSTCYYDGRNNSTCAVFKNGAVLTAQYDEDKMPVRCSGPGGPPVTVEFDEEGRWTRYTDEEGFTLQACYGASGGGAFHGADWSLSITNEPYGRRGETVTTISDGLIQKCYHFDQVGRLIAHWQTVGPTTTLIYSNRYDAAGNLRGVTDGYSFTNDYEYDALGRLIRALKNGTESLVFQYDNRDNLTMVRDARGGVRRFVYDRNDRLTQYVSPLGRSFLLTHSPSTRTETFVDAKGQKAVMLYDARGLLSRVEYYLSATSAAPVKTVSLTYDSLEQLASYSDGVVSGTNTYDARGRLLTKTVNYGPFTLSCAYEWYANGALKSFRAPNGIKYTFGYDAAWRLARVSIPSVGDVSIAYPNARDVSIVWPGGGRYMLQLDEAFRPKAIEGLDPAGNALLRRSYTYNRRGEISSIRMDDEERHYRYDVNGQLVEVADATRVLEAFAYDALGNRTSTLAVAGWYYDADNALTNYGNTTCTYDANGNMVRRASATGTNVYVYDIENRLIRIEDGDGHELASYAYDPFGRRIRKTVNSVTTYYFYSDEGLVGEYDAAGTEIRSYLYVPEGGWSSDPLLMRQAGVHYYYYKQHLGIPVKLADQSGRVVWEGRYDAFGACTVLVATVTNNLRLPGHYFDAESGLHYNGQRYYDPTLGRYLTPDPIGLGLNPYLYSINNPVSVFDEVGLCSIAEPLSLVSPWGLLLSFACNLGQGNYAEAGMNLFFYALTRGMLRLPRFQKPLLPTDGAAFTYTQAHIQRAQQLSLAAGRYMVKNGKWPFPNVTPEEFARVMGKHDASKLLGDMPRGIRECFGQKGLPDWMWKNLKGDEATMRKAFEEMLKKANPNMAADELRRLIEEAMKLEKMADLVDRTKSWWGTYWEFGRLLSPLSKDIPKNNYGTGALAPYMDVVKYLEQNHGRITHGMHGPNNAVCTQGVINWGLDNAGKYGTQIGGVLNNSQAENNRRRLGQ